MYITIVKALPDDVVKALCNTLIYSLWQGLVLAAIAGLVVVCTRRATSAMRYNLLVASLLLFACDTVYTFVGELHVAQVNNAAHTVAVKPINDVVPQIVPVTTINEHATFTENLVSYLNTHANLIVLIWFLVVCARSIQLLTGLNSLYHLRRRSIFAVDKEWQNRVYELSVRLGITRMVSIAESGIAKVPMVIGHLKPMILIPVGLITALSPAEVDAILVHELAHIRRRDYLVNLLQSLMEIVFFFNPAVLWISTLIKTERENCCDDIALEQTSNKANYIRALVSCQEYQHSTPEYAMAFSGKKNHLLGRVKRMISNSNQSLNMMEKSLLAICLLTAALVTTAFSNADKISKLITETTKTVSHMSSSIKNEIMPVAEPVKKFEAPVPANVLDLKERAEPKVLIHTDTSHTKFNIWQPSDVAVNSAYVGPNGPYISYIHNETGTLYQVNYLNNAFSSLQVNGKTIPGNKLADYQLTIDKIVDEINDPNLMGKKQLRLSAEKANLGTLKPLDKLDIIKAEVDSANKISLSKQMPMNPATSVYQPQVDNYKPYKSSYKPYNKSAEDSLRNRLINEMLGDGIIASKNESLSFKLSTSEFIVNGKRQLYEVYQKYRAEYVKAVGKNEWSWLYNFNADTKEGAETKSTTKVTTSD